MFRWGHLGTRHQYFEQFAWMEFEKFPLQYHFDPSNKFNHRRLSKLFLKFWISGLLPRIIKDESGPKKKPYYGKKKPQKMQDKKVTDEGQSISGQQQQDDQLEGKTSQSEVAKEEEV